MRIIRARIKTRLLKIANSTGAFIRWVTISTSSLLHGTCALTNPQSFAFQFFPPFSSPIIPHHSSYRYYIITTIITAITTTRDYYVDNTKVLSREFIVGPVVRSVQQIHPPLFVICTIYICMHMYIYPRNYLI